MTSALDKGVLPDIPPQEQTPAVHLLLATIEEQQETIQKQQAEIETLKAEVARLKKLPNRPKVTVHTPPDFSHDHPKPIP